MKTMKTTEAAFALFSARDPERGGTREQLETWRYLCNGLRNEAMQNADVQILGPGAALLTLPGGLPSLSQCVADVRDKGIHYKVLFFDQPLLSFVQPKPPKEE